MDNNTPIETWKPIPDFEGYYEASSLGQIRGVDRVVTDSRGGKRSYRERVLKQRVINNGYMVVMLSKHGAYRPRLVHRLILKAFAGVPADDLECRHLNGDPKDNRIENLRWGTRSENSIDQVNHGTHRNTRKTHCKRGHEFTAETTGTNKRGARLCLICRKRTWDEWYARNKKVA